MGLRLRYYKDMNAPLDPSLRQRALDLCETGYRLLDQGDPPAALRQFYRAWTLIPIPQTAHEESGWILTAIGDAYLAGRRYPLAVESFRSASCCEGNTRNPLIRFKLGQSLYELGETQEAAAELVLALEYGGEKVFAGQHGKYLTLAKLTRKIPD